MRHRHKHAQTEHDGCGNTHMMDGKGLEGKRKQEEKTGDKDINTRAEDTRGI